MSDQQASSAPLEQAPAPRVGENSPAIDVQPKFIVFQEIPADFRLLQLDRRAYTAADKAQRQVIQEEMNCFLARASTPEEMFPDTSSGFVLAIPRRYSQVRADDINRMFPNSDKDARLLLDRYVQVFQHNFSTRLLLRRFFQFLTSLLMLGLGAFVASSNLRPESWPVGLGVWAWPVAVYIAAYFAAWIAYQPLTWFIAGLATPPREHSAQALSQNMLERLQALGNCLNEITVAERDYFDRQELVWVAESNYLTSLLVWLPMRAYHLENYFQLKMARIRTAMWYGQFAALVIALVLWLVVCGIAQLAPIVWFVGGELGRTIFMILTGVWALHSSLTGATRLDAIRKLITIDKWQTLGRIHMHTQLADVVGFLIKKFIMLRDAGRDV